MDGVVMISRLLITWNASNGILSWTTRAVTHSVGCICERLFCSWILFVLIFGLDYMTEEEINEEVSRRFDRDYPNGWSGSQYDYICLMDWYRYNIGKLDEQKFAERKKFWKSIMDWLD